ncbi:MAG TPA: flagellar hook-basal body complex protein FliE [Dehalococcoidia bacterium]
MQVNGVGNNLPLRPAYGVGQGAGNVGGSGGETGFAGMLSQALHDLAQVEQNATDLAGRLAAGEEVDVHDVVLATEMESLAFSLAMQVRNRLVEAYQEVFRMQI